LRTEVTVSEDPPGLVAERLTEAAAKGGHIAVTGGSTPRRAYERAATLLDDWSAAELWLTDERCVPPDHEHSNYAMVERALLRHIEGRPPGMHRMRGEEGPERGPALYEEELRANGFAESPVPALDLVLLGLGADGHTCSLFPGDPALGERKRWAVGVETPGMPPLVSRITLTLPVVNASRAVVFLVTGEDKAEAVARSFAGASDPRIPGSLVAPESGELVAVLDEGAASRL